MDYRVKTLAAQRALGGIVREEVKEAAGNNVLVSKDERLVLPPFILRQDKALRVKGGKGSRVKTDALIDRTMRQAMKTWARFNPKNNGLDSVYLSKSEIAEIEAEDPELAALTRLAFLRVQGKALADDLAALRDAVQTHNFAGPNRNEPQLDLFGTRFDMRPGSAVRDTVPKSLRQAHDFYFRAEQRDWASVVTTQAVLGGKDVYALAMTTDGDDGYLEIFSKSGRALVSGELYGLEFAGFDPFFGALRHSYNLAGMSPPRFTEDMPLTQSFSPSVTLKEGEIKLDARRPWKFDRLQIDAELSAADGELAHAALAVLVERSLQHRVWQGRLSFEGNGELRLGEKRVGPARYLVADWKDKDDDSRTLYFQRREDGTLELKIEQYN